jgi:hypothetical protein
MAPPYELEVRVYPGVGLGGYLERGAVKVDDRTAVFRTDDLCDLPI